MINLIDLYKAQSESQDYQSILDNAVNKLSDHLKKIDLEKSDITNMPNANDLFDVKPILGFLNAVDSFFSDIQPVKPAVPQKPSAPKTNLDAELSDCTDFRDTAFFDYMQALKKEQSIEKPLRRIFVKNMDVLTSTFEFVKPYLKNQEKLRRTKIEIKTKLTKISSLQRNWCEYFIESFLPLMCLFMAYEPFEKRMRNTYEDLSKQLIAAINLSEDIDQAFREQWTNTFFTDAPENMDIRIVDKIEDIVEQYDDPTLNQVFETFQETKTSGDLLVFYRQVCHLRYQDQQAQKNDKLQPVYEALILLYPNMQDSLQKEEQTTAKELAFHQLIAQVVNSENESFFSTLADKYMAFLKDKNRITFYKMYSHIYLNNAMSRNEIVKEIKKMIKAMYPEAVDAYMQQFIAHIDKKDCNKFIKSYKKLSYDNPIYKKLLKFAQEPTWFYLKELQEAIAAYKNQDYYQAPHFRAMMKDLTTLCVKSRAGLVEDNQSVASDDSIWETNSSRSNSSDRFSNTSSPAASVIEGLHAQSVFKPIMSTDNITLPKREQHVVS